jgi:hypothetical protein
MTIGNFDWFLHSMLFLHTERVIKKQIKQAENEDVMNDKEDEEEVDDD